MTAHASGTGVGGQLIGATVTTITPDGRPTQGVLVTRGAGMERSDLWDALRARGVDADDPEVRATVRTTLDAVEDD